MKSIFLDKLIDRIDRLDPESLQTHFMHLARERGLLEMIFQAIQEGVLVVDAMGRLSYANRAAGQMLGFQPDHVIGKPVTRFMEDLDWDHILDPNSEEWSRLITREIELRYPEHRIVNFYVVPLSGEHTHDSGAVVILRDVTRERLQEASVLQSERMNAVQLLAAGVAHEIGNPLNALNIHLQLLDRDIRALRESAEDPSQQARLLETLSTEMGSLHELVDIARSEVSRLDLIITQFLRAIRPTRPKLEAVRIERLLEESLTLLRHEVRNRAIRIDIAAPGGLPEIRLDASQIKQVFFNIIKNAFQAMPDGGVLRIELRHEGEFLCVAFRDTGVGIDATELGRVFEPYHTTKSTGSGLGLMIVQRIVQDHGGHLELMSKPEEGTQVSIYLPYTGRRMRLPAPAEK
ncbi:MAG: two-component system sensor histidine kinase NtrB, partial [Kiritimatiellia bacterium]